MGDVHHLTPPAPSDAELEQATRYAADVIAFTRERPAWNWLVRKAGDAFHAHVSSPDYVPLTSGLAVTAIGSNPADAFQAARRSLAAIETNDVRPAGPAGNC